MCVLFFLHDVFFVGLVRFRPAVLLALVFSAQLCKLGDMYAQKTEKEQKNQPENTRNGRY